MSTEAEHAKAAASIINDAIGWEGAIAEYRALTVPHQGYTGRVVLSARGAAEVVRTVQRDQALQTLKRRLKGDIEELEHEARTIIRRYEADKRAKAEALAEVLAMLP